MNQAREQKRERRLVLNRETVRRLADPASAVMGPQTSCIDPCCEQTVVSL
jgi:hypothetical protein